MADKIAIEVKSSKNISHQDLKSLKALREGKKLKHYLLVCMEKTPRVVDGIQIIPWEHFLEKLWKQNLG